ncbi:MAG: electron transfer flavoprotein-ubiquinone oxidoreductase [Proteobacteria bacterium]|nr:electron transfer flavoprotein-ubiquinone oxidoreductase [Pseudomonadota bacterium]
MPERESMRYDVVIVGAGPSGLSAAIRLRQLALETGHEVSVCVLEKGSEVGAHILSGAVVEPRALDELMPDWKAKGAPLNTQVSDESFLFLTAKRAIRLPNALMPRQLDNHGNYIISLGDLCRWLARQAEELGVEIYPGFAAAEVLYDEDGRVKGVATGDMGVARNGSRKPTYQPGVELHGKYTFIAEGVRGSLAKTLMQRFRLRDGVQPQTFGLGIKELWAVDPAQHRQGLVVHSFGWPLDSRTYGGAFIYHLENNQVAVGFVVGLDYWNPHLSPFEEMQRFKTHPAIRPTFEGGERRCYGARAISEGGLQALPRLVFPGGALLGCSAGVINVPKVKGTHNAMKTGMLAAEAAFAALRSGSAGGDELAAYTESFRRSWAYKELKEVRNCRPAFHWGLALGTLYTGIELNLLRGRAPWTLRHREDHKSLRKAAEAPKIEYPKPDGKITFDRLSSVYLANVSHEEDQPVHLRLADPEIPIRVNLAEYDAPEQRYCPAGVYEIVRDVAGEPRLQINATNCVHCKTCDIKDPAQNINWVVPEGGGGPNYPNM